MKNFTLLSYKLRATILFLEKFFKIYIIFFKKLIELFYDSEFCKL